jgi:hypothetical protein
MVSMEIEDIKDSNFLYKKNLEEKLVKNFKTDFYNKIGYYPQVITLVDSDYNIPVIKLTDLVIVINEIMEKEYGNRRYHEKLYRVESRVRKREVTEYRYIYFKLGRVMNYTLSEIYNALRSDNTHFDHTTVLHGCETFDSLLQTNKEFALKYQGVVDSIRTKFINLNTDDNDGSKGIGEQDTCEEDILGHEAGGELQVNM